MPTCPPSTKRRMGNNRGPRRRGRRRGDEVGCRGRPDESVIIAGIHMEEGESSDGEEDGSDDGSTGGGV